MSNIGDEITDYINSPEGRAAFAKAVEEDTWGKGRPKVYMNDKRQVVEHWKDGTINIIEQLPPLPPNNITSYSFKIS